MSLDSKFFKPFVEGTIHTLSVQCGLEIQPLKPFIKGKESQPVFSIAAVIGITSTAFNGTITLCFPENVFLGIMGKMLSDTFTKIDKDLCDGAAELLNIIFGQAKKTLNEQGYTIQKAIPSVISGDRISTAALSKDPVMVLPFRVEFGEFFVEICSEPAL